MPGRDEAIARIRGASFSSLKIIRCRHRLGIAVSVMLDTLAPEMPFINRAVIANRWLTRPPLLIAMLEGAPASNAAIRTTTALDDDQGRLQGQCPANRSQQRSSISGFFPGDTVGIRSLLMCEPDH